jgi:hypothetical protein
MVRVPSIMCVTMFQLQHECILLHRSLLAPGRYYRLQMRTAASAAAFDSAMSRFASLGLWMCLIVLWCVVRSFVDSSLPLLLLFCFWAPRATGTSECPPSAVCRFISTPARNARPGRARHSTTSAQDTGASDVRCLIPRTFQ